jgi:16S rRNA (guanine966-N2)-methyltransferase
LRIIAGAFRGRKLHAPRSNSIRPTADRVREAIFNILADAVIDARVLDLFAGTGALGLEALSRGAIQAVFIDQSSEAVRLITDNVRTCGVQHQAQVVHSPILRALPLLPAKGLVPPPFHLVFVDPPYETGLAFEILPRLLELSIIAAGSLAVVEHRHTEKTPETWCSWSKTKERRYGDTAVSFFICGPTD